MVFSKICLACMHVVVSNKSLNKGEQINIDAGPDHCLFSDVVFGRRIFVKHFHTCLQNWCTSVGESTNWQTCFPKCRSKKDASALKSKGKALSIFARAIPLKANALNRQLYTGMSCFVYWKHPCVR